MIVGILITLWVLLAWVLGLAFVFVGIATGKLNRVTMGWDDPDFHGYCLLVIAAPIIIPIAAPVVGFLAGMFKLCSLAEDARVLLQKPKDEE